MWVSPTSNRSLPLREPDGLPIPDGEARFDAAGNVTRLAHLRRLDWSWRGTLARAVIIDRSATGDPDDAEHYVYGADRQRVRRVHQRLGADGIVETTDTVYLDGCEIRRIRRGPTVILERRTSHVADGAGRIAIIHRWVVDALARETDDPTRARIHYQLADPQGTSMLELDGSGGVIAYEEYFPYGGSAFLAGDRARDIELREYRYTGKVRDDATGLDYYGYRYAIPWIGRWLSPDPAGPLDSLNLYEHTLGNPTTLVDEDGLDAGEGGTGGEIRYHTRPSPKLEGTVAHQEAQYRAYISSGRKGEFYRGGFDSLSAADKERLVTEPGVMLVPVDLQGSSWVVSTKQEYERFWGPILQQQAQAAKTSLNINLFTDLPGREAGLGGGSGRQKPEAEASPAQAPKVTPSDPGATEAKSDGKDAKNDAAPDRGEGGSCHKRHGRCSDRARDGKDTRQSQADGVVGGTGVGLTGVVGGDPSLRYGELGGVRGGRVGGMVGGTPYSDGSLPGAVGTRAGSGLPAGGAGAGAGKDGEGDRPSGSKGKGTSSGVGGAAKQAATAKGGAAPKPRSAAESRAATPQSATGTAGDAGGGESAGGTGGSPDGDPNGDPNAQPGGKKYGALETALELAGNTQLVFENAQGGSPEGVPGGMGLLGLKGRFWQYLYVALAAVDLVGTILGVGALLKALKAGLQNLIKLGLRAWLRQLGRKIALAAVAKWRGLLAAGKKLLGVFKSGPGALKRLVTKPFAALADAYRLGRRAEVELLLPEAEGLARSAPVARSLGAMSRAEQLAKQLGMNIESATTRQLLNSLDDRVVDFVGRFRQGRILRELPGEVLEMSVEEALRHSRKARKLLTDGRFAK